MPKTVILMSGGVKSAVCAARVAEDHELLLVHVDFGQPAFTGEQRAIERLMPGYPCAQYFPLSLPHVIELDRVLRRPESADRPFRRGDEGPVDGDGSEPAGRHSAADPLSPATVRGLFGLLGALGMQCALRAGATSVVTGLNEDGLAAHLGLPVKRGPYGTHQSLIHAIERVGDVLCASDRLVEFQAPLMELTTEEILRLALHLGIDPASTWTCIRSGARPCGQCEPCTRRAAGFAQLPESDPLLAKRADRLNAAR